LDDFTGLKRIKALAELWISSLPQEVPGFRVGVSQKAIIVIENGNYTPTRQTGIETGTRVKQRAGASPHPISIRLSPSSREKKLSDNIYPISG
jgi:DNA-binding XRE family transcriptional regulator